LGIEPNDHMDLWQVQMSPPHPLMQCLEHENISAHPRLLMTELMQLESGTCALDINPSLFIFLGSMEKSMACDI